MWVRGLKSYKPSQSNPRSLVAPHVGAWIEIVRHAYASLIWVSVAPHVGAWIEILYQEEMQKCTDVVAPHVGAWIEMIPKVVISV